MSKLNYAIIGTGAIGGYYGAKLQQSGAEVHFLLRSDYAHVKQHGLSIVSVNGNITLPTVNAYNNAADIPPVDVAIIALKTTHNHRVHELLPAINPGGAIVCLQNGFGVEAAIAQRLKEKNVAVPTIVGGLCFIGAVKTGPGQVEHTDYGHLLLGAYPPNHQPIAPTALMQQIAAEFTQATVPIDLTDDLPMARWRKLVWNVPYNGLSVVLDATTEEMMADDGVRSLITTLMTEVVTTANAWGEATSPGTNRHLSTEIIDSMLTHTDTMSAYRTSMKVDFDENRPLEIEAILGNAIAAANTHQVAVPAMTMLHQQLAFLDKRQQSS